MPRISTFHVVPPNPTSIITHDTSVIIRYTVQYTPTALTLGIRTVRTR